MFRGKWPLLLYAFALLYVFPYFPAINNPNENVRLYMTAAIVEDGSYCIDGPWQRWGAVQDASVSEGRHYSTKAPGTSLLGVPGYALYYWGARAFGQSVDLAVATWLLRLTAAMVPAFIFFYFFYRFIRRFTSHPWLLHSVFFSVALGSNLFAYALLFVSHTASAIVAFSAFMCINRAEKRPSFWLLFAAGLFTAAVTLFEYPGIIASVALTVYAALSIRPRRKWGSFVLGAAIPTLLMMHFQWQAFGNPFMPGHLLVENPAFRETHSHGFFGATGITVRSAVGLTFDPGFGLFLITPLLLLAVPGLIVLWRKRGYRRQAIVSACLCVGTYLAIASFEQWHGGWVVGPRYLAVVVPFLGWAAVVGADSLYRSAPRLTEALAAGGCTASLILSGLPSAYYPHVSWEIERPLRDLFAMLLRQDFAPANLGNFAGVYGTISMAPLGLVFVVVAFSAVSREGWRRWRWRAPAAAAFVLAIGLVPALTGPPLDQRGKKARAFVLAHWFPQGHDLAARWQARLGRLEGRAQRRAALFELRKLYEQQGRLDQARKVDKRLDDLSEP